MYVRRVPLVFQGCITNNENDNHVVRRFPPHDNSVKDRYKWWEGTFVFKVFIFYYTYRFRCYREASIA